MKPRAAWVAVAAACMLVAGCASVGVGLSIPIGGMGGVSVGVGSDGRVSGGVSVGHGGVSVGVGGTGQLPPPQDPAVRSRAAAPAASAASAAAVAEPAASAASSPNT